MLISELNGNHNIKIPIKLNKNVEGLKYKTKQANHDTKNQNYERRRTFLEKSQLLNIRL